MNTSNLTAARLRELLCYDPDTGVFTHKSNQYRVDLIGKPAGSRIHGRLRLCVDGEDHYANRLVWLYMTEEWPPSGYFVDHIDRDKRNDRWRNFRLLTRSGNGQNSISTRGNVSGHRGVTWHGRSKTWRARITDEFGKRHHLGCFPTIEAAGAAYLTAKLILHPHFSLNPATT